MTKILDIQKSITAANGNVSLAKELFSMLLDDLDLRLNQIETSFQSNNLEVLAEHIHKLYGATAYCIVPKLRENAERLEDVLRQKNHSQLNKLVDLVLSEIRQLISEGPAFLEIDWLSVQVEEKL